METKDHSGYSDLAFIKTHSIIMMHALCQRSLKKLRTLNKISKCDKFGTKSTHFEFKVR